MLPTPTSEWKVCRASIPTVGRGSLFPSLCVETKFRPMVENGELPFGGGGWHPNKESKHFGGVNCKKNHFSPNMSPPGFFEDQGGSHQGHPPGGGGQVSPYLVPPTLCGAPQAEPA